MIDIALKFLVDELNTSLFPGLDLVNDKGVELCRLVDDSGKSAIKPNHIGASVINLEEERTVKSQLPDQVLVDGKLIRVEPEIKLNVWVIFAANFGQYDEGLKYISQVLTFFQAHHNFTQTEYPGLDPRIERLMPDLYSLSLEQVNQVWTFIGGKQLPSVVYRVRMIVLQDLEQSSIQPPITRISAVAGRR